MAKVADTSRVTARGGAIWRECSTCGTLAALSPNEQHCPACVPSPVVDIRRLVGVLAAAGIRDVRTAHTSAASDTVRVAALVEIAGAAATLARLIAKNHHVDPDVIAGQVRDSVDAYAVLGRGRWLPTMTRHVAKPMTVPTQSGVLAPLPKRRKPKTSNPRPATVARSGKSAQPSLFELAG